MVILDSKKTETTQCVRYKQWDISPKREDNSSIRSYRDKNLAAAVGGGAGGVTLSKIIQSYPKTWHPSGVVKFTVVEGLESGGKEGGVV